MDGSYINLIYLDFWYVFLIEIDDKTNYLSQINIREYVSVFIPFNYISREILRDYAR